MNAPAPKSIEQDTPTNAGQIYAAMAAIMKNVGAVGKNGKTDKNAGGYAYRKIEDVYASLQGLMAEHGVFSLPQVIKQRREERPTRNGGLLIYTILTVRFTFYAADGSSVQAVTVGEGMDSSDKSSNKAMSAAEKYALVMAFKIPTWLRDSEDETPRPGQKPDAAPAPGKQSGKQPSATPEQRASAPAAIGQHNPLPPAHRPQNEGMRRWRRALSDAFQSRDLSAEGRDAACKAFLDTCGAKWLDELDPGQRNTLLMQVRSGHADRFKSAVTAAS